MRLLLAKMVRIALSLLCLFSTSIVYAGNSEHLLNISLGVISEQWSVGVSTHHRYRFALPVFIGIGLRAFHTSSWSEVQYTGVKGTSGSIALSHPSSQSVNALLEFGLQPLPDFELGMNIDWIGLTVGPHKAGTHPSPFNLLLAGAHDKGTLNSEFYCGWRYRAIGFRMGLQHLIREIQQSGEHYRQGRNLLFIGLNFRI